MRVSIAYNGFNMRENVEYVNNAERTLWFFRDHNIEHEICHDISMYNPDGVIKYPENLTVELPVNTMQQMQQYSKMYNLVFVVYGDFIKIQFGDS